MIDRFGKTILIRNLMSAVIAILVFIMLVSFVVILAGLFFPQEKKNADKFIESLGEKLEILEDGSSDGYLFQGIDDWYLVAYGANERYKPAKCVLDGCLCICPIAHHYYCETEGLCERFRDFDVEATSISGGGSVNVGSTSKLGSPIVQHIDTGATVQCIRMDGKTIALHASKKDGLVRLFSSRLIGGDYGDGHSCMRGIREFSYEDN
jgi:hypothetical protein